MTRRGHRTATSTWTWTRPHSDSDRNRHPRLACPGLGVQGFCATAIPPAPQGYDQAGWCGWWCDCCHTIYAYTETRQLSCWNSDALKYNYWEMCDCRLVSVYVRSHTYSQCVCMYMCVCVYCFVYSHRNVTSQSGSLSLSIMFGVLLLPVDAITRPCPALPVLALPSPPLLLTHAHPLPLPHNIIIYASKMT